MNLSLNFRKELRTAAVPWAVTFVWMGLWYGINARHEELGGNAHDLLDTISLLGVSVMLHLLSVALFAGESVWGTLPQLLAAPVSRSVLWRDKTTVQLLCLGSVFAIPLLAWAAGVELWAFRDLFGPEARSLPLITPLFLTSACVVPWIALKQRNYLSSVLGGLMTAPGLAMVVFAILLMIESYVLPGSGPSRDPDGSWWGYGIYWTVLLGVCALASLAGRRLFFRLEVVPPDYGDSALARLFRSGRRRREAPSSAAEVAAGGGAGAKAAPAGIRLPRALLPFWKEWRQLRPVGLLGVGMVGVWGVLGGLSLFVIGPEEWTIFPFGTIFFSMFCGLYVILSAVAAQGFSSEYEHATLSFLLAQPTRREYHFLRKLAASGGWMLVICGLAWGAGCLMVLVLENVDVLRIANARLRLSFDRVNEVAASLACLSLLLFATAPLLSLWVRSRSVIFLVPFIPVVTLIGWFLLEDQFHLTQYFPPAFDSSDDMNVLPFLFLIATTLLAARWRFRRLSVR